MEIDPNNEIVKLCSRGMGMEGQQNPEEAKILFMEAWRKANSDVEKFTAAHYVAIHQVKYSLCFFPPLVLLQECDVISNH